MDLALARFVRALRAGGVATSSSDTIDAARAVALIGYSDRSTLKNTLGIVLAKSEQDKAAHDRLFDLYFSIAAHSAPKDEGPAEEGTPPTTGDADIDGLLSMAFGGDRGGQTGGSDASSAHVAMQRAADAAGVDEIRFQSQTSYYVGRMLNELGIGALETRLLAKLMERSPEGAAEAKMLSDARGALQRQARSVVNARYTLFGRPSTDAFLEQIARHQSISSIGPADLPRMKGIVQKMARRLAIRHARRRRIRNTGMLDVRKTLRANAGNDWIPFTLVKKYKRRDKPKFVAICDVSSSVAVHSRFLILFLYTLHEVISDIRTFAFASSLLDVGPALENMPFDDAMNAILKHAGGSGTDYGRAFSDIATEHADCIDRRTTVLILGDGRSNDADPRIDLFRDMCVKAKRVIWLCTEPKGRWGTGDSCMLQYKPYCSHVRYCASAADLERAVDDALETYS